MENQELTVSLIKVEAYFARGISVSQAFGLRVLQRGQELGPLLETCHVVFICKGTVWWGLVWGIFLHFIDLNL